MNAFMNEMIGKNLQLSDGVTAAEYVLLQYDSIKKIQIPYPAA